MPLLESCLDSRAQLNDDSVGVLQLKAWLGCVEPFHEPFFMLTGCCLAAAARRDVQDAVPVEWLIPLRPAKDTNGAR